MPGSALILKIGIHTGAPPVAAAAAK